MNTVRSVSRCDVALATPKSMIFGVCFSSWVVTSTFDGLMSRWMIPFWCACCTPAQTSMNSVEPFADAEPLLVAVLGDRDPVDVFHGEVGTTLRRRARVEHARDVRMVHQRQRLAFRLEARDDFSRVHSGLDHLERDLTADRLLLLGQPHFAHAALADGAQQPIRSDHRR